MPAGEAFTERQIREITRTVRAVESATGMPFSVFVGEPDGDAAKYAERLHAALPDSRHSVLLVVSPNARRVEVVTGTAINLRLTDRDCALAALSMSSSFAGGDLAGGIVTGLRMLSDRARPSSRRAPARA